MTGEHQREIDHLGIGVTLNRNSYNSSDELFARIGYKFSIYKSGGDTTKASEKFEEVLPTQSSSNSWSPRSRLHELYVKPKSTSGVILPKAGGFVRVRVDLFSANPLTEVVLCPIGSAGTNGNEEVNPCFLRGCGKMITELACYLDGSDSIPVVGKVDEN